MTDNHQTVKVGGIEIGLGLPVVVIAGPCVIEDRDTAVEIADVLAGISSDLGFPLIFKASFDKANRSSIDSYRGPGREKGLVVLGAVKAETGLPVTTDIHSVEDAIACAATVDLIQVPAFLCRQTDILAAAGATGLPVNVKKGQFLAPGQVGNIIEKVGGQAGVMITERGTAFGYGTLVNDFAAVPELRRAGCPLVFDVTHSVQTPGSGGTFTGGRPEAVPVLARCAAAAGYDALFFEVHCEPDAAPCDSGSMISPDDFRRLMIEVLEIASLSGRQK